jgi:hypothetical protein
LFEPQPEGDTLDRLACHQQTASLANSHMVDPMLRGKSKPSGEIPPQLVLTDADLPG